MGVVASGTLQKMVIDGASFVLVPEAEYEDLIDVAHARAVIALGEESFPADVAKEMMEGSPIRAIRKYRGLTMASLAEKAGLSQPAIADIESGRRKGRPATMKTIAEALDVAVDDII